jgi:pimeloyl-ACP methyl ester carboxylesterase
VNPTVFCLHALGSSSDEFDLLRERLAGTLDVVGIDLPGFGGADPAASTTVEGMVEAVERAIGKTGSHRFLLLGHSMGGKVATIVASRTLSGANGLFGLAGVVLLAASTLTPEPMDESRREDMLGWATGGPISEADARTFVDANTGDDDLPAERYAAAVRDVERSDPYAWRAWLLRGSLEDWSDVPTPIALPALVVAGGADGDLGPEAQRTLNLPNWVDARSEVLEGAGHLLPLERPDEVAALVRTFWTERAGLGPVVPEDVARTIASPRTSARTRGILAGRAVADDPARAPQVLSADQLAVLRLLADLVVPQTGPAIDLAARVDAQLAAGIGDGWRPDVLPPDPEAYRAALDGLADLPTLDDAARRQLVGELVSGDVAPRGTLTSGQLTAWFEDARVDLVKQWAAHPASMAQMDYDGYANGGDGIRKQGFTELSAGSREPWEPRGNGHAA